MLKLNELHQYLDIVTGVQTVVNNNNNRSHSENNYIIPQQQQQQQQQHEMAGVSSHSDRGSQAPRTPLTSAGSYIDWPTPDEEQKAQELRKSARKLLVSSGFELYGATGEYEEDNTYGNGSLHEAYPDAERFARSQLQVQKQIAARVKSNSRRGTPRVSPGRSHNGDDDEDNGDVVGNDQNEHASPPLFMSALRQPGSSNNNHYNNNNKQAAVSAAADEDDSLTNQKTVGAFLVTPNPQVFQQNCEEISNNISQIAVDMMTAMEHLGKFVFSHEEICHAQMTNVADVQNIVANYKQALFHSIQNLQEKERYEEAWLVLLRAEEYLRAPGDPQSHDLQQNIGRLAAAIRASDSYLESPQISFNSFGNIFSCSTQKLLQSNARKLIRMVKDMDYPFRDTQGRVAVFSRHEQFEVLVRFIETAELEIPADLNEWNALREEAIFYEFETFLTLLDTNPPEHQ